MSTWRDHVSADTKILIDKLCNLNEQQQVVDKKQTKFFIIFLGSLILLLIYAFVFLLVSDASFLRAIANFFINVLHIILLLIPLTLFFIQAYFQSKFFSIGEQFENLRLEAIDHLKCSWLKDEHTSIRDQISEEMDSSGINLRFKNIS